MIREAMMATTDETKKPEDQKPSTSLFVPPSAQPKPADATANRHPEHAPDVVDMPADQADNSPEMEREQANAAHQEATHEDDVSNLSDAQLKRAYDKIQAPDAVMADIEAYEASTGKRDVKRSIIGAQAHNDRRKMEQAVQADRAARDAERANR